MIGPGSIVGRYVVFDVLGEGGQATVVRARQPFQHEVALKVPHKDVAARLLREARLLAGLEHPNIVTVHAVEVAGPVPHLAMELLRGSLADRLRLFAARGQRGFPVHAVYGLASAVIHALEHVHARGIVHRDLKPANILFDARGTPKVADFGIGTLSIATAHGDAPLAQSVARSAAEGTTRFAGTPLYMAPEQENPALAESGRIDGRADLFALGRVIYEALTFRSPHTVRPVSRERSVSSAWDEFIFRLVEDRPEDRFPDAAGARKALAKLAGGDGPIDGSKVGRFKVPDYLAQPCERRAEARGFELGFESARKALGRAV
jgi:serine/threonine-protein kinase